jgi:hypothetical protein
MITDKEFEWKSRVLLGLAAMPLGIAIYSKCVEVLPNITSNIWIIALSPIAVTVLAIYLQLILFELAIRRFKEDEHDMANISK